MTVVRPGWKRPHCVWLLVASAPLFDGTLLAATGLAYPGRSQEEGIPYQYVQTGHTANYLLWTPEGFGVEKQTFA